MGNVPWDEMGHHTFVFPMRPRNRMSVRMLLNCHTFRFVVHTDAIIDTRAQKMFSHTASQIEHDNGEEQNTLSSPQLCCQSQEHKHGWSYSSLMHYRIGVYT